MAVTGARALEQNPAYRSTRPLPVQARDGADAYRVDLRDDALMTNGEPSGELWFCMEHRRVESGDEVHSSDHLGPFPTEDAAARALETVAEREKAYDAEDSD